MAEYIDKSALYEEIAQLEELARDRYLETPSNSPCSSRYMAQLNERTSFKHIIADFHSADVAPVVRCKDCKYYRVSTMLAPNKFCFRLKHPVEDRPIGYNFAPDDFCSYGERKEND
jgi:hypothetical protein